MDLVIGRWYSIGQKYDKNSLFVSLAFITSKNNAVWLLTRLRLLCLFYLVLVVLVTDLVRRSVQVRICLSVLLGILHEMCFEQG